MGEAQTITIRDYSYTLYEDGILLPIYDAENGGNVGSQWRGLDGSRRFSKGVRIKECAPVVLKSENPKYLLICEGPTDAFAAALCEELAAYTLVGCWSASGIPPKSFWNRTIRDYHGKIITCGDGDKAGRDFNKRIATMCGGVYEAIMPDGYDVRKLIEEKGADALMSRLRRGMTRAQLKPSMYVVNSPASFEPSGADIESIVEASGAVRVGRSGDNAQYKCALPGHNDTHASLSVNLRTGSWKCFAGCGSGGPLGFVAAWKGCSIAEARTHMERYQL